LSPSGTITTIAGTGVNGFSGDGRRAASAKVAAPRGLALDGKGNLYIGDTFNNRVRKIGTSATASKRLPLCKKGHKSTHRHPCRKRP
jgi:hypothetical protein